MKKSLLLLSFWLAVYSTYSQQNILVSISPNTVQPNQTFTAIISGSGNDFLDSTLTQEYIQTVYLSLGGTNNITADSLTLITLSDSLFMIQFNIPSTAPVGIYDLFVNVYNPNMPPYNFNCSLPQAITIGTPNGYIQGRIFNDINKNGVQDSSEVGMSGFLVNITPGGYSEVTDINGDYIFAVVNGIHTVDYEGNITDQKIVVSPFPYSHSVTINNSNSTGNNFPVIKGLVSMYPDSAYRGQTISITVSGNGFFTTIGGANGNIDFAHVYKFGITINIQSNSISVIDSNTAILTFTVPANAPLGPYYFFVFINSTTNYGYHNLHYVFHVTNYPLHINGTVFFDADSNGIKDTTEAGIANEKLFLSPDSIFAFTDVNGHYSISTIPGVHTVSWVQQSPLLHLSPGSPSSYTLTLSTTTGGNDFGLSSSYPPYSSQVTLSPCWAGCINSNFFRFTILNTGLVPYNGYAYFIPDPGMVLDTSNTSWGGTHPDYINGDTLFFNFTNLQPFSPLILEPSFHTPVGGITINYSVAVVSLDSLGTIVSISNNTGTHVVSCSMDPNEKSVKPAGVYTQHYTLLSDSLTYTILFQNTGTDTAYTIIVRDTIDSYLDLSSVEIINSSHPMVAEISLVSNVAKFSFQNILLPDSNTNEAKSHGYVVYRIRALPGTPSNTVVYNKADIYFDFNLPVTTNETFNTLVTTIPVGLASIQAVENNVTIIPNPFNDEATFVFNNPDKTECRLQVFNVEGQKVFNENLNTSQFKFKRGNLSNGLYLYKLTQLDSNKVLHGKFIID